MYIITLADINPILNSYLRNGSFYQKTLSLVSEYRREKVLKLRTEKDKCRSLTAGLLLNYSIRQFLYCKIPTPPLQIMSPRMAVNYYHPEYHFTVAMGAEGKPYFPEHPEICFNLSHSGGYAICIVSDNPCGIDIEGSRTMNQAVAKRFFSPQEYMWIMSANASDEQNKRFLRIWTLKEAYAKTTGSGIAKEIAQVEYVPIQDTDKLTFAKDCHRKQYELMEQSYQDYRIAAIIQKPAPE